MLALRLKDAGEVVTVAHSCMECLKLGAFDYLMKPARFEELTAKLQAARQRKDEHEERVRQAEARLLLRKSGNI